jgi:uncharacterized protein YidB (DUF937 family)
MGILDDLMGAAGNVLQGSGGSSPIARSVIDLLGQRGGLAGLVRTMQASGLGDVVGSWVSTGTNLPISAQQVQQAMGGQVRQLAAQHGLAQDAVSKALSQILPGLVDHLTPGGQVPSDQALEQGLSALRSKLGL